MDYKKSIYNNIRQIEDGRFEIYNSFSKARIIVDKEDFIDGLISNRHEFSCDEEKRRVISLLFRMVFATQHYQQTNSTKNEEIEQYNALGASLGYNIYKNHRSFSSCEACSDWNFMHILPNLSLWKCVVNMKQQTSHIGRILEDGSLSLNSQNILNWYKAADFFTDEKCLGCSLAPDCMGGCIAHKINTGKRKCGAALSLASVYRY